MEADTRLKWNRWENSFFIALFFISLCMFSWHLYQYINNTCFFLQAFDHKKFYIFVMKIVHSPSTEKNWTIGLNSFCLLVNVVTMWNSFNQIFLRKFNLKFLLVTFYSKFYILCPKENILKTLVTRPCKREVAWFRS